MKEKHLFCTLDDVRFVRYGGEMYRVVEKPTDSNDNIKLPFCYHAIVEGPICSDNEKQFVCIWKIKDYIVDALRDLFVVEMKGLYVGEEGLTNYDNNLLEHALDITDDEFMFCDWSEPHILYPINDKVDSSENVDCALCEKIMTCPGCGPNPGDCEDFIKRIK